MVSNQVLGARRTASLVLLAGVLAACSHTPVNEQSEAGSEVSSAETPAATAAPAANATAAEESTATGSTATEAALAGGSAPAASPAVTAAAVSPTAPKNYVVKRGDTLWGIAGTFLKDPWLWPEVWVINPQIPNPHLIYPGDTLTLAYRANGQPFVTVSQAGTVRLNPSLRSSPFESAIPSIPYAAIAAFLSKPTVMTESEIRKAPYIVAFRDMHEVAGSGNEVYVRNLSADQNARYNVMHVDTELRDPDNNKLLGYMGVYTATALVQRPGNPAKALLIDPARETLSGDRLISADQEVPANFMLKTPTGKVSGRIVAVVDGTDLANGYSDLVGQYDVVALNRGKNDGLEPGMLLAVDSVGDKVPDYYRNGKGIGDRTNGVGYSFLPSVQLPDERIGTVLVFKTYDHVSYALVVGASDTIHTADRVVNP
jgi:LysM repeat protein